MPYKYMSLNTENGEEEWKDVTASPISGTENNTVRFNNLGELTQTSTVTIDDDNAVIVKGDLFIKDLSNANKFIFDVTTTPDAGKVLTATNNQGLASWQTPSGSLPSGTVNQTLRHNGTGWVNSGDIKLYHSYSNVDNIERKIDGYFISETETQPFNNDYMILYKEIQTDNNYNQYNKTYLYDSRIVESVNDNLYDSWFSFSNGFVNENNTVINSNISIYANTTKQIDEISNYEAFELNATTYNNQNSPMFSLISTLKGCNFNISREGIIKSNTLSGTNNRPLYANSSGEIKAGDGFANIICQKDITLTSAVSAIFFTSSEMNYAGVNLLNNPIIIQCYTWNGSAWVDLRDYNPQISDNMVAIQFTETKDIGDRFKIIVNLGI